MSRWFVKKYSKYWPTIS